MANRWWIYQRERFPVLAHGPLVVVFSLSALTFSALVRGRGRWPDLRTFLVASLCAFLFFLQMRIFDEWKDYEDDRRYRPYRPVPRGLVTLPELRTVWFLAALVQVVLVAWLDARLFPLLCAVWGYMALMGKEFFVRDWLKTHPAAYMASHMVIMPLIYLFVTACAGGLPGAARATAIAWFLSAGLFNGFVIEIGRKIRAPRDEEHGVETYSALWGRATAVRAWIAAILLSAVGACLAARQIHFLRGALWMLGAGLTAAVWAGLRFLRSSVTARARIIEHLSGAWTLVLHLSLGPLPLLVLR